MFELTLRPLDKCSVSCRFETSDLKLALIIVELHAVSFKMAKYGTDITVMDFVIITNKKGKLLTTLIRL